MKQFALGVALASTLIAAGVSNAENLTASTTVTSINTANHTVTISFTPGVDSGGFDFQLTYPSGGAGAFGTAVTADVVANIPNGTTSCSINDVPPTATLLCFSNANSTAADLLAGTVTVALDIGPNAGTIPLTFTSANFFDQTGTQVNPPTASTTDGSVTVNLGPQPAYTSAPTAPGGTINITDTIGGGATNATLTVTNTGPAGAPVLNIGAASGLSGILSIAPATAQTATQGGAGVTYTISCNAAAAGAAPTQTLSFTHNGSNIPSPADYSVICTGVTGPTPPTASLGAVVQPPVGPINVAGNGSVPVNIDTAGVAAASLALTCTIPATGASNFQITAGGSRTITAPATVGNSAPDIGVSCVRQAAPVSAMLSCAQNATPDPDPAALTAMIDCPAGVVAPNGASNPAPGGTVNATAVAGTTANGNMLFTNTGGTAPYDLTNCTASAGFTITSPASFPATIAANGSQVLTVSCLAPAVGTSTLGTLSCTTTDPVFGNPTYVLSCNGVSAVVPTVGNAGKILLASLFIGLGLLGIGLRRQA